MKSFCINAACSIAIVYMIYQGIIGNDKDHIQMIGKHK
jgi:hypothetical protein